jgi:hypothetical protein
VDCSFGPRILRCREISGNRDTFPVVDILEGFRAADKWRDHRYRFQMTGEKIGKGKKMWKGIVSVVLMTMALLLGTARIGHAGMRGPGHSGFHGHVVVAPRGAFHHEFHGQPVFHHGFHGHHVVRTRIFIGGGFWWGAPWWWGPAYPGYAAPPVVVQGEPPVYVQQGQPPAYWYYCPNPAGYYPYITECPAGWLTVVPQAGPPAP